MCIKLDVRMYASCHRSWWAVMAVRICMLQHVGILMCAVCTPRPGERRMRTGRVRGRQLSHRAGSRAARHTRANKRTHTCARPGRSAVHVFIHTTTRRCSCNSDLIRKAWDVDFPNISEVVPVLASPGFGQADINPTSRRRRENQRRQRAMAAAAGKRRYDLACALLIPSFHTPPHSCVLF